MYCKACGKELTENTEICMGCGVPVGKGSEYCPVCGQPTEKGAIVCVSCGATLVEPKPEIPKDAKSRILAGLLGIFLGEFGVHNFYIKRTGRAVIQLVLSLCYMLCSFFASDVFLSPMLAHFPGAMGFVILSGVFCFLIARVWSLIEAILLLCGSTKVDGRGTPMRN